MADGFHLKCGGVFALHFPRNAFNIALRSLACVTASGVSYYVEAAISSLITHATQRKVMQHICTFLLVTNTNFGRISIPTAFRI